jgi:hypothetical protein
MCFWDDSTMRGQPSVKGLNFQLSSSRRTAWTVPFPRRGLASNDRAFAWLPCIAVCLVFLSLSRVANAQDLTDSIFAINNELLNDTRLTSGLLVAGPPEVAREMSIVDSAMFDAANAASGQPYSSIAYSGGAVAGASVDISVLSAGYTALSGIFNNSIWAGVPYPNPNPTTLVGGNTRLQNAVLAEINATYTTALNNLETAESPPPASITAALALGVATGNANMAANGYTVTGGVVTSAYATGPGGSFTQIAAGITDPYVPANTNPGTYIPPSTDPIATAPASNRVAMFPQWGSVAPVGLTSAQVTGLEATVPGPPPLTSPAYARLVLQTECEGAGTVLPSAIQNACAAAGFAPETTEQAKAALFWNDPGTTFQPPGHWLTIADNLAKGRLLSTLQAARLGALVSQAEDDAGIAAWAVKYQYNLWRPVTAINDCSNWNSNFTTCDPGWASLIATPPHPDYVAGHPAFSGAAAVVLQNYFGTNSIPIVSTSDAYCNGGSPMRGGGTGTIIACVVTPASSSGLEFLYNNLPTIYGPASACSTLGGSLVLDVSNNPLTCTIGATTYFFNPSEYASGTGCNDIVNPGGSNDSLLICPITETFATISDASQGPSGAEFSRVVGGIHTPAAVIDALNLGDQIGQAISDENNIPEPGAIGLLTTALGLLGGSRRCWSNRARSRRLPVTSHRCDPAAEGA